MGGYVSSPELAMCMESVFGSDMDILMWDFGMMVSDIIHIILENQYLISFVRF